MSTRQDFDDEGIAWYKRNTVSGINVRDTLDEIKNFAYQTFDVLDGDGNGFISRDELQTALVSQKLDWRERSYVSFLLRRLEDIASSFEEEWQSEEEGISRVDIQEYFKSIRKPE